MKRKIFTTIVAMSLLLTLSLPVYASSSDWSFSMENRYVNGKTNGEYHSFDEGDTITIDGTLKYKSTAADVAEIDPNDITVVLYRDKTGSDKKIGSYKISSPSAKGTDYPRLSKSFSKKLGTADEDSDDYYLVFFKSEDEGWDVTGSGELSD